MSRSDPKSHSDESAPRAMPRAVFLMGLLFYVTAQVGLNVSVLSNRVAPPEVDDAYGYMLKAVQMRECFLQDAPALTDIRRQVATPTSDFKVAVQRARQYHRVLEVYHPLHSAVLVILHASGLSWEAGYSVLTILGKIFLTLAVGWWLYVLWGPGPAGVALALLAFQVFPQQGLTFVVPTNLALGIAMATWGLVIRWRHSDWARWALILAVIAMMAMHPIGRVYALIALLLFLALQERPLPRGVWLTGGAICLLIAAAFVLPYVITAPALRSVRFPSPEGWTYRQAVKDNARDVIAIVRMWAASYGIGRAGFVVLLICGFMVADSGRRRSLVACGALLAGLLVVSAAYVLPGYEKTLFARNWVAIAIFLTGAVGALGYAWLHGAATLVRRSFRNDAPQPQRNRFLGWVRVALFIAIGFVVWRSAFVHGTRSFAEFEKRRLGIVARHNFLQLDPAQPALLSRIAREGDTVLYMAEIPFYFYLSHGANRFGVCYPYLVAPTAQEAGIDRIEDIRYIVSYNPITSLKNPIARMGQGALAIPPTKSIEIRSEAARPADSLFLRLENRGIDAAVRISFRGESPSDDEGSIEIGLAPGFSGWVQCNADADATATDYILEMVTGDVPIRLMGMRFGRESGLDWPWDQGISVHLPATGDIPAQSAEFTTAGLTALVGRPVRILDDRGSTILVESFGVRP